MDEKHSLDEMHSLHRNSNQSLHQENFFLEYGGEANHGILEGEGGL